MQLVQADINMKLNHNKAFTLIEMLVVISLIGILATLALVSFGPSQKQARDTTRKSDLKQFQTSIENYATLNSGLYPIHTTTLQITSTDSSFCTAELNLSSCPIDPKNSDNLIYKYISNATGSDFVLWAGLENKAVYWVVCSSGRNAESASQPSSSTCPI